MCIKELTALGLPRRGTAVGPLPRPTCFFPPTPASAFPCCATASRLAARRWETSIMQMAQDRGARVWSTPWSPQASFKSNNSTTNGGNFLSASNQAYASQLAGYVANMKNTYGINLYAISIQNEPDVSPVTNPACGRRSRFMISPPIFTAPWWPATWLQPKSCSRKTRTGRPIITSPP